MAERELNYELRYFYKNELGQFERLVEHFTTPEDLLRRTVQVRNWDRASEIETFKLNRERLGL